MNDFCKARTRNVRIDMTKCLDVTGTPHHFEPFAQFLRSDYTGHRQFCDVSISFRFEDESFMTHSVLLAAYSSTFADKFKKPQKCFSVNLKFLDKDSVRKVLDYIYFGKIKLCLETLSNDLEAIAYFEIGLLQEEVEKKLVELAKQGKCVDVLNLVTANMKMISQSPSTMLSVSDEFVRDIVTIFHEMLITNKLPYEETLNLSTNTIITMLSSQIPDKLKVDIINMSVKWICERRLTDLKAAQILRGLTFGSMTYAELVHFRESLIQTILPVTVGRIVRLKWGENDTLYTAFTGIESTREQPISKLSTTSTTLSVNNDPTSFELTTLSGNVSQKTNTSTSNTKLQPSGNSSSYEVNIDDCSTAIEFTAKDLKRLGFSDKK